MRILICGSRNWTNREAISEALNQVAAQKGAVTIVHGLARGADTIAAELGASFSFRVEGYPARWNKYGKSAGIRRNKIMINTNPTVVLAFSQNLEHSRGTADTVRRAEHAGIPVYVWPDTKTWYDDWKKLGSQTMVWGKVDNS